MHVASVTLDEILRAAGGRAAALVPETAGYLALAIGDASARLPYRIEDDLVTLTTEGTVRVARGKVAVEPEEGARVLRDVLRRLLSVSAGTMPGLSQAGTVRPERGGPEAVVAEIEAALIPVNRAAARRSLARLARDVVRAKERGRLAAAAPAPASPPARAAAAAPAPPPAASVTVARALPAPPAEENLPIEVLIEVEPATPARVFVPTAISAAPLPISAASLAPVLEEPTCRLPLPGGPASAEPVWIVSPGEPVFAPAPAEAAPPAQLAALEAAPELEAETTDGDLPVTDATILDPGVIFAEGEPGASVLENDPNATPRLGTPAPRAVLSSHLAPVPAPPPEPAASTPSAAVDAAASALGARLREGRLQISSPPPRAAAPRPRRPTWQAELRSATPSDVDALLRTFQASSPTEESTRMRRDLKRLVGIDATQLPPRVAARTGSS